jgi:murein DD-endopeptidase MepM/ murein hydrolase activator NlpD
MFKQLLSLPIFRTINGRQTLSFWASKLFERSGIKRLFGLHLVAAVIVTSVVTPEAQNMRSNFTIATQQQKTPIEVTTTTETTFEIPLTDFQLSQNFSFWHPGIDMTAPLGTPVYALEAGVVEYAGFSIFGYGKHVIVSHNHGITSLYAHLSEIRTVVGRKIERGELLGSIGSTGWSTGNHLHLEVYNRGKAINPLDVLPIKSQDIKYDGAYGRTASFSATTSASPILSASLQ